MAIGIDDENIVFHQAGKMLIKMEQGWNVSFFCVYVGEKMKKKFKSIISLVCVLILLVPAYAFGATSQGSLTRDVNYDCVYFGNYPQREVVYDAEASGVYGKEWSTTDDYIVDAALYSKLMSATWDSSGDATVEGNKYHRIKKSDATYSISSDWYYSWSDSTTYHYFKYEPIKWRVLEKDGNDAFLLSDIALDDQKYNSSSSSVTWETCSLRSWLNSTFVNRAFTAAEQNAIKTTTVENIDNIQYGTKGGNDTQDKVYLLSESEVYTDNAVKYGFDSSYDEEDKARQSRSSTYAKAMGVCSDTDSSYLGNCWWWLRSPGCYSTYVACVHSYGVVDGDGYNVDNVDNGIHPALHLNLQSLNPEDAGKTGSIKTMSISTIENINDEYVYRNKAVTPKVTVPGLTEGKDYEVAYSDNNAIGTAKVIVTGKGDWSGTITKQFAIVEEIDISDMTISIPDTTYYYAGSPVCPKVTIEGLEEGTDFDVTYEDNNAVGVAKITATGKDGYVGSVTKNFLIVEANEAKIVSAATEKEMYTYTGSAIRPEVTAKNSEGAILEEGTDYTVKYANNKNPGTATATVTGTGDYEGTVTATFNIIPKGTTLTGVTKGKKSFTAKWKKQAVQTTGYLIQYSMKKDFSDGKIKVVKSNKTVKLTVKSLKAKKKYYVRIATYKNVEGEKYQSAWSKAKTVTTK